MRGLTDARPAGAHRGPLQPAAPARRPRSRRASRALALACAALSLMAGGCSQGFDDQRAARSVVRLQHVFRNPSPAANESPRLFGVHGSGIVITADGHVLTTNDLVDAGKRAPKDAPHIGLFVPDGGFAEGQMRKVELVWSSAALNLAVVRVPGLNRPPVTLSAAGGADRAGAGTEVAGVGFSDLEDAAGMGSGLRPIITLGKVSKISTGRAGPAETNRPVVQHSVILRPGSSGGPLMDVCNRVVAVNAILIPGRLRVAKGPAGKFVTYDSNIAGGVTSAHISSFLAAQKTDPKLKDLAISQAGGVCTPSSTLPKEMYAAIGVLILLAAVSMVLALVRRRGAGEVLQAVESYSRIVRRGGGRIAGEGTAAGGTAVGAQSGALWTLEGSDPSGSAIQLLFTEQDLGRGAPPPPDAAAGKEGEDGADDSGVIIGRSRAMAGRVIDDETVSRRHARVLLANGSLAVEDLSSTMGTRVNGAKIRPYVATKLSVGDTVTIGRITLEVKQ